MRSYTLSPSPYTLSFLSIRPESDLHFRPRPFWRGRCRFLALFGCRGLDSVARQQLDRQVVVTLCTTGLWVIEEDRFAVTGRLGQADISRNHSLEELVFEKLAEILGDLLGEI